MNKPKPSSSNWSEDLIEDYLLGMLRKEALASMEEAIAQDPVLADKVNAVAARLYEETGGSESAIQQGYADLQSRQASPAKIRWLSPLRIAAVLLPLLLLTGWLLRQQSQPYRAEALIQKWLALESSAGDIDPRSGSSPHQSEFTLAMREMERGKLAAAIAQLEQIDSRDSLLYVDAQFHLAKAYLGLQQPEKANQLWENIPQLIKAGYSQGRIYLPQLRWFQALTALQAGDTARAKVLLTQNLEQGGDFPDQSQALLDEMNSLWFSLAN